MSIDSALAAYTSYGWKLASNEQMVELLNSLTPLGYWPNTESFYNFSYGFTATNAAENTSVSQFIELFGVTYEE